MLLHSCTCCCRSQIISLKGADGDKDGCSSFEVGCLTAEPDMGL